MIEFRDPWEQPDDEHGADGSGMPLPSAPSPAAGPAIDPAVDADANPNDNPETGTDTDSRSDAELIDDVRSGDTGSYAELWERHAAAARTVARSFTSSIDPDDLVAEAFTRIFQSLTEGKGPTADFRSYLFTTIRNTAASWGRARREVPIDLLETLEDPATGEHAVEDALDEGLIALAFRLLPDRWQEALWYSEVEKMSPKQMAPFLGLSANGVAALCYRAREGLRREWMQAHLNSHTAAPECVWVFERLAAFSRGGLGGRERKRVNEHLAGCTACQAAVAEVDDLGARLGFVTLPLGSGDPTDPADPVAVLPAPTLDLVDTDGGLYTPILTATVPHLGLRPVGEISVRYAEGNGRTSPATIISSNPLGL